MTGSGQDADQVVQHAAVEGDSSAGNISNDTEQAFQHGVDNPQQGADEHEHELQGLGDTGQNSDECGGNNGGDGLSALFLLRGQNEGQGNSDGTPNLSHTEVHPLDGLVQLGQVLGHAQLGIPDHHSAADGVVAHHHGAAQLSHQEGQVDHVVQTGGDQNTVQEAVDKQTNVAGTSHESAHSSDAAVDDGPDIAHHDGHCDGEQGGQQEDKTGAAVDADGVGELNVAELVEQPCNNGAQDDAQEHAHVDDLNAQDGSLAGAGQTQHGGLSQHAMVGQPCIVGIQEDEVGDHSDQSCVALLLLSQSGSDAHAEDDGQLAQEAVVEQIVQEGTDGTEHGLAAQILEDDTKCHEDTGNSQIHDRLHHSAGEALHSSLQFTHN